MLLRVSFNLYLPCRTVLFIPSFNDLIGYLNVTQFVGSSHGLLNFDTIPNYALKHTYQLHDMASVLRMRTTILPRHSSFKHYMNFLQN